MFIKDLRVVTGLAAAIFCVSAVAHDGDLDLSFGTGGYTVIDFGAAATAYGLAIAPDGKIVLGGTFEAGPATETDFAVARLTHDGLPDASFSFDGKTTASIGSGAAYDGTFNTIVQSDGKIVVVGGSNGESGDDDFLLARLSSRGKPDSTFGVSGQVRTSFGDLNGGANGAALQSDGKIVAVGFQATFSNQFANFALARYFNSQ